MTSSPRARQLATCDLDAFRDTWEDGLRRFPSAFLLTPEEARAIPDQRIEQELDAGIHWGVELRGGGARERACCDCLPETGWAATVAPHGGPRPVLRAPRLARQRHRPPAFDEDACMGSRKGPFADRALRRSGEHCRHRALSGGWVPPLWPAPALGHGRGLPAQ